MSRWADVVDEAPAFAAAVQRIFDSHRHKTLATLRSDGSPRLSGIECEFVDGELRFGSMPDARKGDDLRRDPRLALHATSDDPSEDDPSAWPGDAKVAGRAVPAGEQTEPPGELYRVDVTEVVLTRVGAPADHLVIESWHPGVGHRSRRRT
jgi:hypothetical protein